MSTENAADRRSSANDCYPSCSPTPWATQVTTCNITPPEYDIESSDGEVVASGIRECDVRLLRAAPQMYRLLREEVIPWLDLHADEMTNVLWSKIGTLIREIDG